VLEQPGEDLFNELLSQSRVRSKADCREGTLNDGLTLSGWAMTSCLESAAQYITSGHGWGSRARKLSRRRSIIISI
jgi:hypothetical protein